mgnify:CR=1 FL=1
MTEDVEKNREVFQYKSTKLEVAFYALSPSIQLDKKFSKSSKGGELLEN